MTCKCKCVIHYKLQSISLLDGSKEEKELPVPGTPSVFINI